MAPRGLPAASSSHSEAAPLLCVHKSRVRPSAPVAILTAVQPVYGPYEGAIPTSPVIVLTLRIVAVPSLLAQSSRVLPSLPTASLTTRQFSAAVTVSVRPYEVHPWKTLSP